MKRILLLVAAVALFASTGCTILKTQQVHPPHSATETPTAPADVGELPDTDDVCPYCHKPDHTNNGHHYGQHKHCRPHANG